MNNYTTPDFVLETMRSNDLRFFKVFGSDGKSLIVHQTDNSFTLDEAVAYMERTFNNVTGTVHVSLQPRAKMNTGGDNRLLKFIVDTRDLDTGANESGGYDTTTIGAIEERFNARLDAIEQKYKYESEIKDLKRQLEETKQGNPMVEKVLGAVLPMLQPRPQAVAGVSGDDTDKVDDTRVRVSHAVQRLMAVDQDFVSNLEALADLAEQNTAMYNLAITNLKNIQS